MEAETTRELLTACEDEPIRIPGRIQSFGVLLALDHEGFVRQASANVSEIAAAPIEEILGRHHLDIEILGKTPSIREHDWNNDVVMSPTIDPAWMWRAHCESGIRILELLRRDKNQRFILTGNLVEQLPKEESVEVFAANVCEQLRRETGFDRILVYRFDPHWNGEVVAESKREGLAPFLGLHYPASDIPTQARELYRFNRLRFIADVAAEPIPLIPERNPATGNPLDLSQAILRDPSPIHREYLVNMGVRCTLVASLFHGDRLWGLIACHHTQPRAWHPDWARSCLVSADIIASSITLADARMRESGTAFAQKLLRSLPRFLESSTNLGEGLVRADSELMEMVGADGLAVLHRNHVFSRGKVPAEDRIREIAQWLSGRGNGIFATEALGHLAPEFADCPEAAGVMALHIPSSLQGWLLWFRGEHSHTITWAGDPRKAVVVSGIDLPRLCPRKSFEAWVEIVRGKSKAWSAADLAKASEVIRPNLLEVMALAFHKQSEVLHRYHSILFDQVHDAIIVTDLDGVITFWNEGAARTLGWASAEMVGHHVLERIPERERAEASRLLAQVLSGTPFAGRYRDTHKDGHTVWLDVRLRRIHDEQGKHIGIMGASRDVTAEKATYDLLRLKQAIVRQSRDNILVTEAEPVDRPGPKIVYVSPSLIEETGFSEAELIGNCPRIFQGPNTDRSTLDRIRKSLKSWKPIREELLNYRKDGSEYWIELDICPLADETGWFTHWVGIQRNITERKRVEQELREREERFRILANSLPDPIFVVDPDSKDVPFKILHCTPAVARTHGYRPEELVGQSVFQIASNPNMATMLTQASRIPEGESITFSERLHRKDGSMIHSEIRVVQIQWEGRRAFLGIERDMTERNNVEMALRTSQEFLKAIIDHNPQCIKVVEENGTVLQINESGLKMAGVTRERVIGAGMFDLVAPEDRERFIEFHHSVIGGSSGTIEFDIFRSDGERRRIESHAVPLVYQGRRTQLAVSVDVTERRRMEMQFRQKQKLDALGQLAGGIAHDFNNLLTIVKGASELILEVIPKNDPNRELVESISHAGERGAALTRQLLTFSHQSLVQVQVFDPVAAVRKTLPMFKRLLGEDIDLAFQCGDSVGHLRADPTQFEQVLMNLLVNAHDAMPVGGQILLALERSVFEQEFRSGEYIKLTVTDNGSGIPQDIREKMFEPFFTTKAPGLGTGLGLALVYGIVRNFNGFIEFDSEVGKGTSFRIYLPREEPHIEPSSPPIQNERSAIVGETILLVEDDVTVRSITQKILSRAGYTVLTASCGESALKMIGGLEPSLSLIITDVVMPGISGKQLADTIQLQIPGMKFLFLSGYTNDRTFAYGINRDTTAFLQKPVSPVVLTKMVRKLLDE